MIHSTRRKYYKNERNPVSEIGRIKKEIIHLISHQEFNLFYFR
jgi:hypothetical protein